MHIEQRLLKTVVYVYMLQMNNEIQLCSVAKSTRIEVYSNNSLLLT